MNSTKRSKAGKAGDESEQARQTISPAVAKFSEAFQKALLDDLLQSCESAAEKAFALRKSTFVSAIAETVQRVRTAGSSSGVRHAESASGTEGWLSIESLSALRHLVGGRFNNLKQKWVDAGFPLREHRGDKGKSFVVDQKGWIELSNWILKQGFEVRLTPDRPDCLFELRANK